ncbi:MAG: hypothetical protein AAFR87_14080 [Bacteroidota bacterium]
MKNLLIAAAVGSVIIFMWQFLSWAPLGIHESQMAHTDKQDAVLQALAESGLSEGAYFLPRLPASASTTEMTAFEQENMGKPWARVHYHEAYSSNMGLNMFRGWLISFVSVFLLSWILSKMAGLSMRTAIISALSVGLIGWMTITYQESIWFKTESLPQLLDVGIQWTLTGAWLGWFLPSRINS